MSDGLAIPRNACHSPAIFSSDDMDGLEPLSFEQSSASGKGALQGSSVGVGDGSAANALFQDAAGSHVLISAGNNPADLKNFAAPLTMLYQREDVVHDAMALPPEADDVFHDAIALAPEADDDFHDAIALPPEAEDDFHGADGPGRQELLRQINDGQTAARHSGHPGVQTQSQLSANGDANPLVGMLPIDQPIGGSDSDASQREDAAKLVEQQQRGLLSTLTGLTGIVLKPLVLAAEVIDYGQKMVEAGINHLGGMAGNVAMNAIQRVVGPENPKTEREVPKTAREENLSEIRGLLKQLDEAHQKLNADIKNKIGENVISSDGRLTPVTRSYTDTWAYFRSSVVGGLSALMSALPGVSVGLAMPLVAGAVAPMFGLFSGLLLQSWSYVTGAYVALTSLWNIADDANQQAVLSMIEAKMAELKPIREELDSRMAEEKARQAADSRILLAGGARDMQINALRAQLKQVENAQEGIAPRGAKPREPRSVTLGDGSQRRQLMEETMGLRTSFFLFFSRIMDAVFVRRKAANQEHAYVISVKASLDALAAVGDGSKLAALEDLAAARREKAGQGKMDASALRRQLRQGENLARTLLAAKAPNFGVAAFDGGALHGKRAIAATLTTSRLLAQYLDTLADRSEAERTAEPQAPHVVRNDDGSLTVSDPGRKLHSFLMGVPTAYSPGMLLQQGATASGAIVIDDHSPGMPGGMYGMQFEAGLDDAGTGDVLHMAFVPRSVGQVFNPLGDEKAALFRLRDALRSGGAVAGPSPQELAQMPPEELADLHAQLDQQLAPLLSLRERDRAQQAILENWRDPDREAERLRIRG